MTRDQTAPSNRTGQTSSEQPNHLVQAVTALKGRTRQALSPWVQRQLDRASARPAARRGSELYGRTAISGSHTLSLVNHLQRAAERTIVWRPAVGSLGPAMVQRFARTVSNHVQSFELVGVRPQPRQSVMGWGEDLDLTLPTGPAASAPSTGDLTAGSRIKGPSVFSVGQRIPPMASKLSTGPRVPRVSTGRAPRRPQRKPLQREARLFSHIVEVTPGRTTGPEPELPAGTLAGEAPEAADEQDVTAQASVPAGPPEVARQAKPTPPEATSGPSRPGSVPRQGRKAQVHRVARGPRVQRKTEPRGPSRPTGKEAGGGAFPARATSELESFFAVQHPEEPDSLPVIETSETLPPEQEAAGVEPGPEEGSPVVQRRKGVAAAPGVEPGPKPTRPLVQRAVEGDMPLRAAPAGPAPAAEPVGEKPSAPAQPPGPAPERRQGTRPEAVQRKAEPAARPAGGPPEGGEAIQRETEPPASQPAKKVESARDLPSPGPAPVEDQTATGPREPVAMDPAEPGPEPQLEGELAMTLRLPPSIQAAPVDTAEATLPPVRRAAVPGVPRRERPSSGGQAVPSETDVSSPPPGTPAPVQRAAEPAGRRQAPLPPEPEPSPPDNVLSPEEQRAELPAMPLRAGPRPGEEMAPVASGPEPAPPAIERESEGLARPKASLLDTLSAAREGTEGPPLVRRAIAQAPTEAPPSEMPLRKAAHNNVEPGLPPKASVPPLQPQAVAAPAEPGPAAPRLTAQAEGIEPEEGLGRDLWARAISRLQMPLSRITTPTAPRSGRVQRQADFGGAAKLRLGPTEWGLERGAGATGRRSLSPALLPRTPERYVGPDLSLPVSALAVGRRVQRSPSAGRGSRKGPTSPPDLMQAFLAAWPLAEEGQMVLPPPPRPAAPQASAPAVQTQPQPRRAAPTTMPLAQPQVQQLPSGPAIQREVAAVGASAADQVSPVQGELVQRAESPEDEIEEVDLTSLARMIYPLVKQMLAVERERRPRW